MFDIASVDMSTAPVGYGYDADDIYTAPEPFSIDPLESEIAGKPVWIQPGNTLVVAPGKQRKGYVWQVDGEVWKEVEDHRGKEGFVDGEPFTIKKCGALPNGWSDTPPAPTTVDLFICLRAQRDEKLREYDAKVSQFNRQRRNGMEAAMSIAAWDAYADALCSLPSQPGAPWDGGQDKTPWPIKPSD